MEKKTGTAFQTQDFQQGEEALNRTPRGVSEINGFEQVAV